jgi:hypothetical protein
MIFFTIDGDDVGRKITHAYLNNDMDMLSNISGLLEKTTKKITEILVANNIVIIFSAADGVAGYTSQDTIDLHHLFFEISKEIPKDITYSAGAGNSLKDAYIALLKSKCTGKNRLTIA